MTEIPVLGIPILNRGDLLMRCVNSIDYPVGKLVIINNGVNPTVFRAIKLLERLRPNLISLAPGYNMGVAASWNRIIHDFPAPFHFICSNDIQFKRGDLQIMMESFPTFPEPKILLGNHHFGYFMVSNQVMETVGSFDENFHPAYLEDVDWCRRLELLGYKMSGTGGLNAIHGEAPHWNSTTINSSKDYKSKNAITHEMNRKYYARKWGGGHGEETFVTPFNDPNWPLNKWEPDEERRKQHMIW